MKRVLFLLLSLFVYNACSLHCYRCDHNHLSTSVGGIVDTLLGLISRFDDPACLMSNPEEDQYKVDVVECPRAADSGMKYVCGTIRGKVSILRGTVDYDTVLRDCVQVPRGDPAYENTCREGSAAAGPVHFLLERTIDGINSLDAIEDFDDKFEFTGTTCYNDDVGISGDEMQCPTCSFNVMESSNRGLAAVLELLQKKNDPSCKLEEDDDRYRIGQRICRKPSKGKVSRCATLTGTVTATYLEKFGDDLQFTFKTLERGCVEADPQGEDAIAASSGCQDKNPKGLSVKHLIEQSLSGVDAADIDFKGRACYSTGLDIRSGHRQVSPLSLLWVCCVACLLSAILG